jgi:hypothetical protein
VRGQLPQPADGVGPYDDDHDHDYHDNDDHDDDGAGTHARTAHHRNMRRCGRTEQVRRGQREATRDGPLQRQVVELLEEPVGHVLRARRRAVLGVPGPALLIGVL